MTTLDTLGNAKPDRDEVADASLAMADFDAKSGAYHVDKKEMQNYTRRLSHPPGKRKNAADLPVTAARATAPRWTSSRFCSWVGTDGNP